MSSGFKMNEGRWKITVETKMPGTELSIPAIHSQSLTKENPVPEVSIPEYECRLFRKRHPNNRQSCVVEGSLRRT